MIASVTPTHASNACSRLLKRAGQFAVLQASGVTRSSPLAVNFGDACECADVPGEGGESDDDVKLGVGHGPALSLCGALALELGELGVEVVDGALLGGLGGGEGGVDAFGVG